LKYFQVSWIFLKLLLLWFCCDSCCVFLFFSLPFLMYNASGTKHYFHWRVTTTCNTMKRKRTSIQSSTITNSYLPDECWECIFKFIFNHGENNNRHYFYPLNSSLRIKRKGKGTYLYKSSRLSISSTYLDIPEEIFNDDDPNNRNRCRYLNSLSLVSKQLLSITKRIRFSLTIFNPTRPFLCHLF